MFLCHKRTDMFGTNCHASPLEAQDQREKAHWAQIQKKIVCRADFRQATRQFTLERNYEAAQQMNSPSNA